MHSLQSLVSCLSTNKAQSCSAANSYHSDHLGYRAHLIPSRFARRCRDLNIPVLNTHTHVHGMLREAVDSPSPEVQGQAGWSILDLAAVWCGLHFFNWASRLLESALTSHGQLWMANWKMPEEHLSALGAAGTFSSTLPGPWTTTAGCCHVELHPAAAPRGSQQASSPVKTNPSLEGAAKKLAIPRPAFEKLPGVFYKKNKTKKKMPDKSHTLSFAQTLFWITHGSFATKGDRIRSQEPQFCL